MARGAMSYDPPGGGLLVRQSLGQNPLAAGIDAKKRPRRALDFLRTRLR